MSSESQIPEPGLTPADAGYEPQIDPAKGAEVYERLVQRQNLPLALVAGLAAALVGAIGWAVVTNTTGYQIGWMAIGIGFIVGFAIRTAGQGLTRSFGIAGGAFSLFGCLFGNLLSIVGLVATSAAQPIISTTFRVLMQPLLAIQILVATFQPLDVLFYAIAIYEGYKFSFRTISSAELEDMLGKPS
jgi:hypothetical protein